MSGPTGGVSGGGLGAVPGCDGGGVSGGRVGGGVSGGGCCIWSLRPIQRMPLRRVAPERAPVIGPHPFRRPRGRGEIGRRAWFRSKWETVGVRVPPPAPTRRPEFADFRIEQ